MIKIKVELIFKLDEKELGTSLDEALDNFHDYYTSHMSDQQIYDPAIEDFEVKVDQILNDAKR